MAGSMSTYVAERVYMWYSSGLDGRVWGLSPTPYMYITYLRSGEGRGIGDQTEGKAKRSDENG